MWGQLKNRLSDFRGKAHVRQRCLGVWITEPAVPLTAPGCPAAQTSHPANTTAHVPAAEPPPASAEPTHHSKWLPKPTDGLSCCKTYPRRLFSCSPIRLCTISPLSWVTLSRQWPSQPISWCPPQPPVQHTKLRKNNSWEGLKHPLPHTLPCTNYSWNPIFSYNVTLKNKNHQTPPMGFILILSGNNDFLLLNNVKWLRWVIKHLY